MPSAKPSKKKECFRSTKECFFHWSELEPRFQCSLVSYKPSKRSWRPSMQMNTDTSPLNIPSSQVSSQESPAPLLSYITFHLDTPRPREIQGHFGKKERNGLNRHGKENIQRARNHQIVQRFQLNCPQRFPWTGLLFLDLWLPDQIFHKLGRPSQLDGFAPFWGLRRCFLLVIHLPCRLREDHNSIWLPDQSEIQEQLALCSWDSKERTKGVLQGLWHHDRSFSGGKLLRFSVVLDRQENVVLKKSYH